MSGLPAGISRAVIELHIVFVVAIVVIRQRILGCRILVEVRHGLEFRTGVLDHGDRAVTLAAAHQD